eukprot:CAMPEP_0113641440 /NCGR_PEP_ID=MMETSP0017_2-20120614/21754_1 /TAXON_ID=2856 /ORGANISM="Cylindrotheca closterium" /LENGTH=288 /DNA_ID=CAMNT_0000552781 /DNA_START=62 /DNA_END=925 /DNA_ORIENTATION=- /assembly_acc=CAM_ASM_000147
MEDFDGEWDYSDSDSDSDSECSYETMHSDFFYASGSDGLSTIIEETEKDLMSKCSDNIDTSYRSIDASIRSEADSLIEIPRPQISLVDANLERNRRRHKSNNLDVTSHHFADLDNSESGSLKEEEIVLQKSFHGFATTQDDDVKSFSSSTGAFLRKSANSLTTHEIFQISTSSFETQGSDDAKSDDSSSPPGSFRLSKLKLKKSLSLRKLKQAIEAADISSSFRKDDGKASECIDSMVQALLKLPVSPRASKGPCTVDWAPGNIVVRTMGNDGGRGYGGPPFLTTEDC